MKVKGGASERPRRTPYRFSGLAPSAGSQEPNRRAPTKDSGRFFPGFRETLTIVVTDYLATTTTRNTHANSVESDHWGSLPGTSGNYSGHSYGRADDGS